MDILNLKVALTSPNSVLAIHTIYGSMNITHSIEIPSTDVLGNIQKYDDLIARHTAVATRIIENKDPFATYRLVEPALRYQWDMPTIVNTSDSLTPQHNHANFVTEFNSTVSYLNEKLSKYITNNDTRPTEIEFTFNFNDVYQKNSPAPEEDLYYKDYILNTLPTVLAATYVLRCVSYTRGPLEEIINSDNITKKYRISRTMRYMFVPVTEGLAPLTIVSD